MNTTKDLQTCYSRLMTTLQTLHGIEPEWALSDRLAKARETAGLSCADMASVLGVSLNTIGRYENGHGVPKRSVIISYAMATGVSLAWLEGEAPVRNRWFSRRPFAGVLAVAA